MDIPTISASSSVKRVTPFESSTSGSNTDSINIENLLIHN